MPFSDMQTFFVQLKKRTHPFRAVQRIADIYNMPEQEVMQKLGYDPKSATATIEDGKDGSWKTVKGSPVWFPDGEDPKDVIDKAFKGKPKTRKELQDERDARTPTEKPKEVTTVDEALERYDEISHMTAREDQGTFERQLQQSDKTDFNIPKDELQQHMMKEFGLSEKDARRQLQELDEGAINRYKDSYVRFSVNGDTDKRYFTDGDRKEQQRKFDVLLTNNKEHSTFKNYFENETRVASLNLEHKEVFESTPSFFRGTSSFELDHYGDTTKLGGDKNGYKYVAVSTDPTVARKFSGGVIVEYEGNSIRANGKPVEYSAKPITLGQSKSVNTSEAIGKPMNVKFSDEKEIRVKEAVSIQSGSPNGVKIKNIFVLKDAEGDLKYNPTILEKITGAKVHILEGDFFDDDIFSKVMGN